MKTDVHKALMKKATAVQKGAELLMERTRDWQIIKAYLCNRFEEGFELTPAQEEKMKRYKFIYDQIASGKYTETDVVNQVTKLYHVKIRQAYEDLSCAKEVFNAVINVNKLFELNIEIQITKQLRAKAIARSDFDAAAKLGKNLIELNKQLPEPDENPGEFFEGHEIEAVFDPRLLGAPEIDMKELLAIINKKRNKQINIDLFEEIAHEDVTNEEAAPL